MFHRKENLYWNAGYDNRPNSNLSRNDYRTLHLSIAAGVDLTPLIEFWGVHPDNLVDLTAALKSKNVKCSKKILD